LLLISTDVLSVAQALSSITASLFVGSDIKIQNSFYVCALHAESNWLIFRHNWRWFSWMAIVVLV